MLCGKNRTDTRRMRILDLQTASFVDKKWKQERNQYGGVCRGDLLRGIRQRHGKEKRRSWRARNVGDTARLRKGERTVSTEWWRERHRKETRSWKGSTWTRTNKDFFFYTGGQDASRGQARIHKQRWPQEQEVYKGGEKHEENTVRSATECTRGVSHVIDGKRRSRSSKNTTTGCQQM